MLYLCRWRPAPVLLPGPGPQPKCFMADYLSLNHIRAATSVLGHKTFSNMKSLLLLLLLPDIKANQNGISILSEHYNRISGWLGRRGPVKTHAHTQSTKCCNVACVCVGGVLGLAYKRFVRKYHEQELTPTADRQAEPHTHTHTHRQWLWGGNCVKRDFRFSTNVSLPKR